MGTRYLAVLTEYARKPILSLETQDAKMVSNKFSNCQQAFKIGANSNKQLFILEASRYDKCRSKFGDQSCARMVYDGRYNPDGTILIYDDCSSDLNSSKWGR